MRRLRNAECPVSGRFLLFPAQPCGSAFRPFETIAIRLVRTSLQSAVRGSR
jgi:hypothetical protein